MADWYNTKNDKNQAPSTTTPTTSTPSLPFTSRRSPLLCRNGCVATSQPLASSIGLQILLRGGNACDAAIATAAALAVVEPCSTGLGGDMFALHYDSGERVVGAVNGSGRCPANLTIQKLREDFPLETAGDAVGEGEGTGGTGVNMNKFRESGVHGLGGDIMQLTIQKLREDFPLETAGDAVGEGEGFRKSGVHGLGGDIMQPTLGKLREDFPLETAGDANGEGDDTGGTVVDVDVNKFRKSAHSVTVPGAARGWEDYYLRYGSKKFTFAELLEPAAQMAEDGFPVAPLTAKYWCDGIENDIKKWIDHDDNCNNNNNKIPFTIDGTNGPKPGDIFKNPHLANVLRSLGTHGATNGFYNAFPGQAIVQAVRKHGGVMTQRDMDQDVTTSTFPQPIAVEYDDQVKLWQIPPNGQGIAGLIALKGFEALRKGGGGGGEDMVEAKNGEYGGGWKSSKTWHAMIESMRLGFADARAYVCDNEYHPSQSKSSSSTTTQSSTKSSQQRDTTKSSTEYLLDKTRISSRIQKHFDPTKATIQGMPDPASGTVSFQIVDSDGNAVSFVNSNFMGFGTGIVPDGCGFSLQNRGFGFSLDPDHPNALMPGKRPYHTIIPGMLTHSDTNELYATLSNMGGYMQPQGHMQLTVGLVSANLDPQTAIDMPRFCIADGTHDGTVYIEDGIDDTVVDELADMGHRGVSRDAVVKGYGRSLFGKAQIIKRDRETGVLWAGSDARADGCAMGY